MNRVLLAFIWLATFAISMSIFTIIRLDARVSDLEYVVEKHQTVLEHLTEGLRHERVP